MGPPIRLLVRVYLYLLLLLRSLAGLREVNNVNLRILVRLLRRFLRHYGVVVSDFGFPLLFVNGFRLLKAVLLPIYLDQLLLFHAGYDTLSFECYPTFSHRHLYVVHVSTLVLNRVSVPLGDGGPIRGVVRGVPIVERYSRGPYGEVRVVLRGNRYEGVRVVA